MKTEKTFYLTGNDFTSLINELNKSGQAFTIRETNYTTSIIIEDRKFISGLEKTEKRVFGAYNKIKADILKCNIEFDFIPQDQISYFSANNILKKRGNMFFENIYNVDISSAYPRALFNLGFITQETLNYLMDETRLKKGERLKAIGLLAGRTIVRHFDKGQEVTSELVENTRLRGIFMLVCYEVGEIMNIIKNVLGSDFLFYWVDGIYFKSPENIQIVTDILKLNDYNYKIEVLNQVNIKNYVKFAKINFLKEGQEKKFIVPFKKTAKK